MPPNVTAVPKEKVDTTSLSETFRTEAYVFNDGRDVEVFGVGGGCKEARAEVTAQSAEVVQIALVVLCFVFAGREWAGAPRPAAEEADDADSPSDADE